MQMTIKHLQLRGGRLRYRRKIPVHLREYSGGRSEIVLSLGLKADQKLEAANAVDRIDSRMDMWMEAAERYHLHGKDPHDLAIMAEAWAIDNKYLNPTDEGRRRDPSDESDYGLWVDMKLAEAEKAKRPLGRELELEDLDPLDQAKILTVKQGKRLTPPLSIDRAVTIYAEYKHGGKLKKAEAVAVKQLKDFLGPTKSEFADVTRATARDYLKSLADGGSMGSSTIRRRLSSLRAIYTFGIDHHELVQANPWKGLEVPKVGNAGKASTNRLPFNKDHLTLLECYLSGNRVDRHIKAILRLLRETGCRPLEIAGLAVGDILLEDATPHIWIRANVHRRIKTAESDRRIPLTTQAVTELRNVMPSSAGAEAPIFPTNLIETNNLSQRLNKAIRVAGVPKSPRLVSYSFRHTLTEALRVSRAPEFHMKAIMGHSAKSITDNYGAGGVDLGALLDTLSKAKAFHGQVPDHVYTTVELAVVT